MAVYACTATAKGLGRKRGGGGEGGGGGSHRLGDEFGDDPSASIDQHAIISGQLQIPQQHDLCPHLPVMPQLQLQPHMSPDRHAGWVDGAEAHVNAMHGASIACCCEHRGEPEHIL